MREPKDFPFEEGEIHELLKAAQHDSLVSALNYYIEQGVAALELHANKDVPRESYLKDLGIRLLDPGEEH